MSQIGVVRRLLHERGAAGVEVHELVYDYGITDSAAIVFRLRNEGWDIETIDNGEADDGRKRLCTYVLKSADRLAQADVPPGPLPVAPALKLPCGCVRAPGGIGWESRCESHWSSGQPDYSGAARW